MRCLLLILLLLAPIAMCSTSLTVVERGESKYLNNTGAIWYTVKYANGTTADVKAIVKFDVIKLVTEVEVYLNGTLVGNLSLSGIPPLSSPRYLVKARGPMPKMTEEAGAIRFLYDELRGNESLDVSIIRFNATELSSCSMGEELKPLKVIHIGAGIVADVYEIKVMERKVECEVRPREVQLPRSFPFYALLTALSLTLLVLSTALTTAAVSRLRST